MHHSSARIRRTCVTGLGRHAAVAAVALWSLVACSPQDDATVVDDDTTAHEDVAPEPTDGESSTDDTSGEYGTPPEQSVEPGVSLRRLDRLSYNNTVRDLFGVDSRPADAFLPDTEAHGFDNLSDHLSVSPLLMEYYVDAAKTLAADALTVSSSVPFEWRVEVETLEAPVQSFPVAGVGIGVYSESPLEASVELPEAGDYTFEVRAWVGLVSWPGLVTPQLAVLVDGEVVQDFSVIAQVTAPATFSVTEALDAGPHTLAVHVVNPQYSIDEETGFSGVVVTIDWFRVVAPEVLVAQPSAREAILICSPDDSSTEACGETILRAFVRRAWRRPPGDAEIAVLLEFVTSAVADGEGFDTGIQRAIEAALVSPHFLFLVEVPPDGDDDTLTLTDHQMASRLSYFLWSSMPDEALFAAADAGELRTTEQLVAQAERMLDHPRSQAFFDNIADQWLLARKVGTIQPNPSVFTSFDSGLREAMADEVRHFFRSFADGTRTIFDLVASTDLFVDDTMAAHYGLEPVGPEFVHLETHDAERGGILRQAGVLAANSHPFRTSPTRRGQWILERLLCTEIGTPPPGQGLFFDPERADEDFTKTPNLLLHFSDPSCAGCHSLMDPLGLALENYDAIGRWQPMDESIFTDLETVFDADTILHTAEEVIDAVVDDPAFPRCVVQQFYTYALGRAPLPDDELVIDGLVEQLPSVDHSLRALLVLIAQSAPFRERLSVSDEAEERP